jgi:transcriptional regulator with XRE-family HTH domain
MESIGERMTRLRKSDGKTQDDIVDALKGFAINTNRSAISKWENDVNTPELATVMALSKIYGVTSDYLIEGMTANNTVQPNEKAIIEAVRENPTLAQVIDCARKMSPEQIKKACKIMETLFSDEIMKIG